MDGERIRVEVERTGGFGGLRVRGAMDSADLAPPDRAALTELLAQADLAALGDTDSASAGSPEGGHAGSPEGVGRPPGMPDAFEYRLSIQRGPTRWAGTLRDPQVPAGLRPLLKHVLAHGRSQSR
jgi:hypothetical protein